MKTDQVDKLLADAVRAIGAHAPVAITLVRQPANPADRSAEACVEVAYQGRKQRYALETRNSLNPATLLLLLTGASGTSQPVLLLTPQLTASQASSLKKAKIQFLDTMGNAYLDMPPLHLLVMGATDPGRPKAPPATRGIPAAAVRVIYVCLADPSDKPLNLPYRTLADRARVSIGTVAATHSLLETMDFIAKTEDGLRLQRRKILVERWVAAFADRLRPKLLAGRYRAPNRDWWRNVQLNPSEALWGGEPAAAHLTRYLKPEVITLYRFQPLNKLILNNDLRQDPAGQVEILDAFWRPTTLPQKECVHPLLAYADLIASGNDRNIETAKELYDRHLQPIVHSD